MRVRRQETRYIWLFLKSILHERSFPLSVKVFRDAKFGESSFNAMENGLHVCKWTKIESEIKIKITHKTMKLYPIKKIIISLESLED